MSQLMFYTHPMSRGRIVRWMLEEVAEPYETTIVPYDIGLKSDWYLEINPMGKIPAVKHNDHVVTECAAICAYLAHVFPQSNLAPAPEHLAEYYRWLFFGAGPLEQATVNQVLGVELTLNQEGMAGYGSLGRVTATLSRLLQDCEFVAGNHFTAADLYLSSHIHWNMDMGVLERRPEYLGYVDRMHSRAAHTKAQEIDDAEFAKLEAKDQPS